MYLLNTTTRKLESFAGYSVPSYAILSHTWGEEEVILQDLNTDPNVESKKGYAKIKYACDQAIRDGLDYCWVDTCCIDKTSSAELSEAINSMFLWYQNARVCYAYLSDVTGGWEWLRSTKRVPKIDLDETTGLAYLAASRWFMRGWTLQELIAPRKVIFFDQNWKLVGSRANLAKGLHRITRIDPEVLADPRRLWGMSVAKRLSWAAHRETTRKEDEAYCLLGLFSINMPLLYGEGAKAFLRLQEAIIRESTDHTIFAWDYEGKVMIDLNKASNDSTERADHRAARLVDKKLIQPRRRIPDHVIARKALLKLEERFRGELLAPSVQYFASAADILQTASVASLRSHEITSVGLRITLPMIDAGKGHFLAVLQCQRNGRQFALELRDPTYRSRLNLRPTKTQVFELCAGETQSRLSYVLPRSIGAARDREIMIVKPRVTKIEEAKEIPNTMFVHFRDSDQLRLETLWPASYWDMTGWDSRVHVPEHEDIRMLRYSAASTSTDPVAGIGGLAIRDEETGSVVYLCFNCRRGVVRGKPALQIYTDTAATTLQDRCKSLERIYISDIKDYKDRYMGYSYISQSGHIVDKEPAPTPVGLFPTHITHPPAEDEQLRNWLEKDDKSQSKLEKVTVKTTLGLKNIVATMKSEGNEHSSHVVLKIVATPTLSESARRRWDRLNTLDAHRSRKQDKNPGDDDGLFARVVGGIARILH